MNSWYHIPDMPLSHMNRHWQWWVTVIFVILPIGLLLLPVWLTALLCHVLAGVTEWVYKRWWNVLYHFYRPPVYWALRCCVASWKEEPCGNDEEDSAE